MTIINSCKNSVNLDRRIVIEIRSNSYVAYLIMANK